MLVRAGERQFVEIAHENHGDLVLSRPVRLMVVPVASGRKPRLYGLGRRTMAPYLAIGQYDVFEMRTHSSRWLLGRVTIHCRQVTRLEVPLFAGSIAIHLLLPEPMKVTDVQATLKRIDPAQPPLEEARKFSYSKKVPFVQLSYPNLPPGRYVVTASVPGFEPIREDLTVTKERVYAEIALR